MTSISYCLLLLLRLFLLIPSSSSSFLSFSSSSSFLLFLFLLPLLPYPPLFPSFPSSSPFPPPPPYLISPSLSPPPMTIKTLVCLEQECLRLPKHNNLIKIINISFVILFPGRIKSCNLDGRLSDVYHGFWSPRRHHQGIHRPRWFLQRSPYRWRRKQTKPLRVSV